MAKPTLLHPHGASPGINGKQCSCVAGVIELAKYSWSELQRQLRYECNCCNKSFEFICADEHRFMEHRT